MRTLPTSNYGKVALALIAGMLVLFVLGSMALSLYEGTPSGDSIPADIIARPLVSVPMVLGYLASVVACVVGLVAILKYHDHAVLVYATVLIGGGLLLMIVGEAIAPHY